MALGGSPVIVVGMHRSGTSAVTRILSILGCFFGESSELYQSDSFNRDGYWEHKKIIWLNRRFEMSLNLNSLGTDPLPECWIDHPFKQSFQAELKRLLNKSFQNQELWGWKDPDNSWFIPFSEEVLVDLGLSPKYVICVRNPIEVADSQWRRNGTPTERTIAEWLRHTLAAIVATEGGVRQLTLFHRLIENPVDVVNRLIKFIDLPQIGPQAATDAVQSINRANIHSSAGLEFDYSLNLAKETFDLCLRADDDPEKFKRGDYDLQFRELLQRLDLICSAFRHELPSFNSTLSWSGGSQSILLRPNRNWQKIRFQLEDVLERKIKGCLYAYPGLMWVRNSRWLTEKNEKPIRIHAGRHAAPFEQGGVIGFQISAGSDQIQFELPSGESSGTLEIELLIEVSHSLSLMHSKTMVQTVFGNLI